MKGILLGLSPEEMGERRRLQRRVSGRLRTARRASEKVANPPSVIHEATLELSRRLAKAYAEQDAIAALMGEPPKGFSALDRRIR